MARTPTTQLTSDARVAAAHAQATAPRPSNAPSRASLAVGRAPRTSAQPNVVPASQQAPRVAPTGGDFRKQAPPPPKGVGSENVGLLIMAALRLDGAIKPLAKSLPAFARAASAAREALLETLAALA